MSEPPLLGTPRSKWIFLGDFVNILVSFLGCFRVIKGHYFLVWGIPKTPPQFWKKFPNNPSFFEGVPYRSKSLNHRNNSVVYPNVVNPSPKLKICPNKQHLKSMFGSFPFLALHSFMISPHGLGKDDLIQLRVYVRLNIASNPSNWSKLCRRKKSKLVKTKLERKY